MPEDEPRQTEESEERSAAREGEAEQAAGGDAEGREDESQDAVQSEQPDAPERPEAAAPEPGADEESEAEERARLEAEATREAAEEPAPLREPAVELDTETRIQATGKRKTSVARVILRSGTGEFEINRRSLEDYFPRHQHQTLVRQPLLTSGYEGKVDVRVRVHGGGITGQAGAVRHGLARALTEIDPELRGDLKRRGLLTRDARAKERRKAGLKKAHKRPQFPKR
jgi:small subunit ribosomal protein S9